MPCPLRKNAQGAKYQLGVFLVPIFDFLNCWAFRKLFVEFKSNVFYWIINGYCLCFVSLYGSHGSYSFEISVSVQSTQKSSKVTV